jgi:peptidoglycan/LPS O-acetylase OafA/YrhL
MTLNSRTKRYEELDAMRGLAALMVVFFHFTMGREGYNTIFKAGNTGVDLFFIISGFVIFMSLHRISSSREFIVNRVSRLYPTYWASVTFTFILVSAYLIYKGIFSVTHIVQYLGNLTMFQYYLGIRDIDGPYWTMIIEMLFYISILLLYHFRLLKYLNVICLTLCAATVTFANFFPDSEAVKSALKWFPLLQYIPLFFAGTVFYRIYKEDQRNAGSYAVIVFCALCQLALFSVAGRARSYISFNEYIIMVTLFFTLFTAFVNNALQFIVNRVTLFLGKISFALYLTHQYVANDYILPALHKLNINFWVAAVGITLPIVIGIASFITYYIEIPFSKKMKSALKRKFTPELVVQSNSVT